MAAQKRRLRWFLKIQAIPHHKNLQDLTGKFSVLDTKKPVEETG
jgi:hypothetical protein